MISNVMWRSQWGLEWGRAIEADNACGLSGTGLMVFDEIPYQIEYVVETDPEWRTRHATIDIESPGEHRRMVVEAHSGGGWTLNSNAVADLSGCTDIDFGFSPSTNTLPIRRLELETGAHAVIEAAWLRFPELTWERLEQTYERLSTDRYRYSSGTFTAILEVSESGLVVDYENLWAAIARF